MTAINLKTLSTACRTAATPLEALGMIRDAIAAGESAWPDEDTYSLATIGADEIRGTLNLVGKERHLYALISSPYGGHKWYEVEFDSELAEVIARLDRKNTNAR